jgi:cytochrome P450
MQERWDEPGAEYAPLVEPSHAAELTETQSDAIQSSNSNTGPNSQASKQRPKRFFPFSLGTRDCVGQNLARMNYTTTVAMLLAHFNFQLSDEVGFLLAVDKGPRCKNTLHLVFSTLASADTAAPFPPFNMCTIILRSMSESLDEPS